MTGDKTPNQNVLVQLLKKMPFLRPIVEERDDLRRKTEQLASELAKVSTQSKAELARVSNERDRFKTAFAPGHYYSSVPNLRELDSRAASVFNGAAETIPGVELNAPAQEQLLFSLAKFYGELPFAELRQPGLRYFYENPNFSYGDAIVLYSMIRHLKPKRIVEIGCGFSSCVSLDTNQRFFGGSIRCTFIDPYPQLLHALLTPDDVSNLRVLQEFVQDVPLATFSELEPGDILFVDSSHVLKTGGDLNYILFQILPCLQSGVYVHFHDTPFPFEYPKEWVYAGRAWNECYALRAFLQYNGAFEIAFFNTYVLKKHRRFIEEHMPLCLRNEGGSLWIRKTRPPSSVAEGAPAHLSQYSPGWKFDAVYLDHPRQLGRGWFDCDADLAGRWSGVSAEVVMRGPERPDQQIVLKGFQPNPSGVKVSLSADDIALGTVPLSAGYFEIVRPLPGPLQNRERIVVRLQLDKAYVPPQDGRELGLSFGTIEIK